jgi:transglutaminase-like putative cysteine protease
MSIELEGAATFDHSEVSKPAGRPREATRVGSVAGRIERLESGRRRALRQVVDQGTRMGRDFLMSCRSLRAGRALRMWLLPPLGLLLCGRAWAEQESWDAIYLAGAKIGYVHTFVEKVKDKNGIDYLRVRIDIEQKVKRDKDVSVTSLMYGTIETLDGEVKRLDTLISAGEQRLRGHGDVIAGQMKFMLEGAGGAQELVIPWGPEVRGPYAPEQSMAKKPMKDGEERSLKMFMPDLNKICDVRLQARSVEPVILGDGMPRPLLRVEQITSVDGKPRPEFDATLWVDTEGQILKSEQDLLGGVVMYRTTEQAARSLDGPIQFDLILAAEIKVQRKIPQPEDTRDVKYRVVLKRGDAAKVFPADPRQTITPEANPGTAILEVKSTGPADGQPGPDEADREFLEPNALVTSGDTRVRALARQVTSGSSDPWKKAVRINEWVYKNIDRKNFKVAFATASEVARNFSGDCTEHAVLAAALCRASNVPARVAIGLVYVKDKDSFGYHMWNEVYVNGRWVALDPSWDQTAVDATHIKLCDSSLNGVSPFNAFLPLLQVMGKLEIEPLELR